MFKHFLLACGLAGIVAFAGPAMLAQQPDNDQQAAPGAMGHEHGGRHFDPEKRTEMLSKQLKLSSDQKGKVLDILKTEQSQMQGLHSDSSMSQQDRRAKMMDIHKASNDQLRELLNPDQQKKFDEIQSKHEHWQHGEGGQPSGGQEGPPQQ